MSMIPTAQVLCDILNDPAIPAEAKPEWCREWLSLGQNVIVSNEHITFLNMSRLTSAELENKELFWSLSVWLWERDVYVWVEPSRHGGWFAAEDCGEGGPHVYPTAPSPVEALAAVVREVAALGTLPP